MPLSSNDGSSAKIILTNTGKVTQPERALDPRSVPIGQAGGPRKMQRDRPQRGWQANASRRRASSNAPIGRRADRSSKDGCRANASAGTLPEGEPAHDLGRAREHGNAGPMPRRGGFERRQKFSASRAVASRWSAPTCEHRSPGPGSTGWQAVAAGPMPLRYAPQAGSETVLGGSQVARLRSAAQPEPLAATRFPERAATSRGHAISCRRRH